MKKSCLLSLLLFTASVFGRAAEREHPNVLLIISDDQGIGDFGFMGNDTVRTPNLDRLAEQSALFTNFIVAPACSPTRASLMTGRNHMKAGVWGVGPRNNLMRDETLMPEFFKAAGYGTGYFGKRDGIYLLEMEAWERGCDEASHVTGYVHKDATSITHTGMVPRVGWTCDVDVDTSLDYIRRKGDGPWWCTTAFILPHLPWEPAEEFAQPYRDAGCSERLAAVYGCVTQLDDAIGRLLRGLEELGHADDTIVLFMSDNGPSYKNMTDEDIANRNPLGLRGSKATAWDNGIRVPLMVRWPGHVPPGERPQFVTVEDILPTLLDMTGIDEAEYPEHRSFDGISVRDAIENPEAEEIERSVFRIAISGEGSAGGRKGIVNDPGQITMAEQHVTLRGPRFKYHNFAGGETALYDIDVDPGETTDVSGRFPEIAARYDAELERTYGEIIDTGRAFRMPIVKIGRPQSGYNTVWGAMAQRIEGGLRGVGFFGVRGFDAPGDQATYNVIVDHAGRYDIRVLGEHIAHGRGWQLEIAGEEIPLRKRDDDALVFGPTQLVAGDLDVSVSTEDRAETGEPPMLEKIRFYPLD
ncbi:sulfatase-like hydrolase/transferase [Kiritimatiella glycovorans]|uniref:Arylsulfatase n=1 Tax=Kiritimatiella glycovorans TaxID=1307763 RepID=A0A0G3EK12_9BACT|nr:sulfatase-like hydrolase/transferase [Kiritimatiella glycovorans]AKJ64474.1 Arylsulfatase [Kiritimatiella glycovorans]